MERFFLELGRAETPDDPVRLWRADVAAPPAAPESLPLAEAARRLGPRPRAVIVVPTERVLLLPVALPVRGRRQKLQALPYALEDQLLEDVESLVCLLAEPEEGDGQSAAACRRDLLKRWLALLEAAGLEAEALVPDALLLPWEPETWTVARGDGERVLVRHGRALGAAVPRTLLGFYLGRLWQERRDAGRPPRLVAAHGVERPPELPDLPWEPAGGEPSPAVAGPVPLDLLAGLPARNNRSLDRWRAWRPALALAAAWLLVLWVRLGLDVLRLGHERRALEQRIDTLFRQTFPEDTRIVDVRVQMARGLSRLEQHASSGHWARLLAAAARVRPPGLRFLGFTYRSGRLTLSVEDHTPGDLVRFLHALAKIPGVHARTAGLTTSKGVTHARVLLENAGG